MVLTEPTIEHGWTNNFQTKLWLVIDQITAKVSHTVTRALATMKALTRLTNMATTFPLLEKKEKKSYKASSPAITPSEHYSEN